MHARGRRRGRHGRFQWRHINRSEKAVAATGKGLDKARILGRVTKGVAQALDSGIQAVIEIHKGVGGPKAGAQLFARDKPAGMFKKQAKDLKRLGLQADPGAAATKLAGMQIGFKDAEFYERIGLRREQRVCSDGSEDRESLNRG